jgi:cyanophycinase
MKKPFQNSRIKCITMGTLVSLLLLILPLFSPCAAGQSATNSRAVSGSNAHFLYWRIGNPKDVHTVTRGGFALIGGGKDLDEAFSWLCKRSGGGNFLVLRATGTDAYNPYIQELCHENSVATLLIPNRREAFDPAVRKRIAAAQAIFISGGDQAKYVNYWQNTPVQRAINDAIRRGVPVGGTSAGLAVQGQFMYSAQKDPEDGPDLNSAITLQNPYLPRVTIVRNFLRIPPLRDAITDTHFSRRDRMGRLLVFMARILQSGDVKSIRGIAVDEHTAVLLTPNGHGTVVGTGAVYFLKASSKAAVCRPGVPLTFGAISVIKVKAGGKFDTAMWSGSGTRYELAVEKGSIHSTQAGGAIY